MLVCCSVIKKTCQFITTSIARKKLIRDKPQTRLLYAVTRIRVRVERVYAPVKTPLSRRFRTLSKKRERARIPSTFFSFFHLYIPIYAGNPIREKPPFFGCRFSSYAPWGNYLLKNRSTSPIAAKAAENTPAIAKKHAIVTPTPIKVSVKTSIESYARKYNATFATKNAINM